MFQNWLLDLVFKIVFKNLPAVRAMRANNAAVIPRGLIVTYFFKRSFESEDNFVFNQHFIGKCSFLKVYRHRELVLV